MEPPFRGVDRPAHQPARADLFLDVLLDVFDLLADVLLGPGHDLLGCHPVPDGLEGLPQLGPCLLDVAPDVVRAGSHVGSSLPSARCDFGSPGQYRAPRDREAFATSASSRSVSTAWRGTGSTVASRFLPAVTRIRATSPNTTPTMRKAKPAAITSASPHAAAKARRSRATKPPTAPAPSIPPALVARDVCSFISTLASSSSLRMRVWSDRVRSVTSSPRGRSSSGSEDSGGTCGVEFQDCVVIADRSPPRPCSPRRRSSR